MSYVDGNRPASFEAAAFHRATATFGEFVAKLLRPARQRATALAAFSPAQLEDMGLSVADIPAPNRPGVLAGLVARFRDWDARRRTISELQRLSDAQLDDIGLTRAHIEELRFRGPLG
jgi:uncharacterized protein YjiS (DUF1127 family)